METAALTFQSGSKYDYQHTRQLTIHMRHTVYLWRTNKEVKTS